MPLFSQFEDFIRALREHTRRGEAHVVGMLAADSPLNLGYVCIACEEHFQIPLDACRGAFPGSLWRQLTTYVGGAQGRRELPRALADGTFDALLMLAGTGPSYAGRTEGQPGGFSVNSWADGAQGWPVPQVQGDTARGRAIPMGPPTLAPETGRPVVVETYHRKLEQVEAFQVTEAGWYDVPGFGVSVLGPGFYVYTESGLQIRTQDVFERHYEKVEPREPQELPLVPRFDREDVV